jgi:hypothetical protein
MAAFILTAGGTDGELEFPMTSSFILRVGEKEKFLSRCCLLPDGETFTK